MFFGGLPLAALISPQQSFVLDRLSVLAAAAYGLRRLRRGYTGPAVRVRRSSDNAEMDIGFLFSGDLNTPALLTFVGPGSGYVTTWYDQSGNARHATQTTATAQPMVVNAGALVTASGKPSLSFSSQKLSTSAFTAFGAGFTVCSVAGVTTNSSYNALVTKTSSNVPKPFDFYNSSLFVGDGSDFGTATTLTTGFVAASGFRQWTLTANSSATSAYTNGIANGSGAPTKFGDATATSVIIGSRGDGSTALIGSISETCLFPAVLSTADRQTLERNQGQYFGITVA